MASLPASKYEPNPIVVNSCVHTIMGFNLLFIDVSLKTLNVTIHANLH